MRKHGWQLPYHPLQVVAVAVFLALGFAFYVFFVPFVGKQIYQYIVIGIYTPLIICAVGLYIWCAGSDPADHGVFKSKKYLKFPGKKSNSRLKESKLGGDSTSSIQDANIATIGRNPDGQSRKDSYATTEDHTTTDIEENDEYSARPSCYLATLAFIPCVYMCNCSNSNEESSDTSEDAMFYCNLCEVEVFKYSKHCRVCDKCVDRFDHHCRWLNNCIGRRNYKKFFTLMISALLLLILQWSTGIVVLIHCFLEHKRFSVDISTKLGSSFSIVPFVIVVAVCTILAMIATLPLVQLFFFHILLIKKGISTYDYIIALREQEQQAIGGQQSPQMSQASSITGLSSASSFNTFRQGAWCTPPRLFVEDQFNVVPPDNRSVSSLGKKSVEGPTTKKNPAPVKISPWALARLNAEEVSKAAADARKKSKILLPVAKRRGNKRYENKRNDLITPEISSSLAPLQLEARSTFRTSITGSSPDSSLDSPDLHPFGVSSSGVGETRRLTGLPDNLVPEQQGIPFSRSTSDGYEASGGEDSDRVPSRIVQRSGNWNNHLFASGNEDEIIARLKASASSSYGNNITN